MKKTKHVLQRSGQKRRKAESKGEPVVEDVFCFEGELSEEDLQDENLVVTYIFEWWNKKASEWVLFGSMTRSQSSDPTQPSYACKTDEAKGNEVRVRVESNKPMQCGCKMHMGDTLKEFSQ